MTRFFYNFDPPADTAERTLADALVELDRMRNCGETTVRISVVERLLGGDRDDLVRLRHGRRAS